MVRVSQGQMRCQNAHACGFLYFKYVLPAGPIATSFPLRTAGCLNNIAYTYMYILFVVLLSFLLSCTEFIYVLHFINNFTPPYVQITGSGRGIRAIDTTDPLQFEFHVWRSSFTCLGRYSLPNVQCPNVAVIRHLTSIFGLRSPVSSVRQLSIRFLQHWEVPRPCCCTLTSRNRTCLKH